MASSVPSAPAGEPHGRERPITMFGPDFPFAYDVYLARPDGLGSIPEPHHGKEVAIIGAGIAGMVAAYEPMKLGLKPVIYEADRIGGRLRSVAFDGYADVKAELGRCGSRRRRPRSSTTSTRAVWRRRPSRTR
jgi:hypothetical protein